MTISITQYGAIFAAANCKLNFDSFHARLEVVEIPKSAKKIVEAALADIERFEDTSNFADGMSAIHLADEIDSKSNPLDSAVRENVLTTLGIVKDGKFVAQQIAQQKTNRSWHLSEKPAQCTYFGEICTHRGIMNVPGKRGRKSTRTPEQYHKLSLSGEIAREQLVTPALENLVAHLPADRIISITSTNMFNGINLDDLAEDQIKEIVERVKQLQEERKNTLVAAK